MNLETRKKIEVNTDPQRRCYHGVHFSSEWIWTEWSVLEYDVPPDKVESRLEFWRDLNQIAIDGRGESARSEYRVR